MENVIKDVEESKNKFYKDTMTGLIEAVIIKKSENTKVKQHKNFEDMFEDPDYFTDEERQEIEENVKKYAEGKELAKRN